MMQKLLYKSKFVYKGISVLLHLVYVVPYMPYIPYKPSEVYSVSYMAYKNTLYCTSLPYIPYILSKKF